MMPDHLRKWNKPKAAQAKNKLYNLQIAEMLGTVTAAGAALDKVIEQLNLLELNHEVRTEQQRKSARKIKEEIGTLRTKLMKLFGDTW